MSLTNTNNQKEVNMNLAEFKNTYKSNMLSPEYLEINPQFAQEEYREYVASKMINSVLEDKGRHDWLKYNDAMRKAAKIFGIKTSKEFREILKNLK